MGSPLSSKSQLSASSSSSESVGVGGLFCAAAAFFSSLPVLLVPFRERGRAASTRREKSDMRSPGRSLSCVA